MSDLKPCPRCGSAGEYGINASFNHKRFVNCIVCGIRTAYHDTWDLAVSDWNTRPDPWVLTSERLPEEGVPVWGEMDRQDHVLAIYVLLQSEWLFAKGTIFVENGRWFNLTTCKDKPDNPPNRWRYML